MNQSKLASDILSCTTEFRVMRRYEVRQAATQFNANDGADHQHDVGSFTILCGARLLRASVGVPTIRRELPIRIARLLADWRTAGSNR
jgi:hypothetical protein